MEVQTTIKQYRIDVLNTMTRQKNTLKPSNNKSAITEVSTQIILNYYVLILL